MTDRELMELLFGKFTPKAPSLSEIYAQFGLFVRQADRSNELACGHTEEEHEHMELLASTASRIMFSDPNVELLDTELALQELERDYIEIQGVSVIRPRHKDYPAPPPDRPLDSRRFDNKPRFD